MFQVPEKSHLFHLFYGPPIVRFTFITVHNISVYGISSKNTSIILACQLLYMYFYLIYMYFTCTVYVNILERKYYGT